MLIGSSRYCRLQAVSQGCGHTRPMDNGKGRLLPDGFQRSRVVAVRDQAHVAADVEIHRAGALAYGHVFLVDVVFAGEWIAEIHGRAEEEILAEIVEHIDRADLDAGLAVVAFLVVNALGAEQQVRRDDARRFFGFS